MTMSVARYAPWPMPFATNRNRVGAVAPGERYDHRGRSQRDRQEAVAAPRSPRLDQRGRGRDEADHRHGQERIPVEGIREDPARARELPQREGCEQKQAPGGRGRQHPAGIGPLGPREQERQPAETANERGHEEVRLSRQPHVHRLLVVPAGVGERDVDLRLEKEEIPAVCPGEGAAEEEQYRRSGREGSGVGSDLAYEPRRPLRGTVAQYTRGTPTSR